MLSSCDKHKELKESLVFYLKDQSMGIVMDYKINDFIVLDTISNKDQVFEKWEYITNFVENANFNEEYLERFLNQENNKRSIPNYYEFAKKNKGASEWIDNYLYVMQIGIKIKERGIENSSITELVQIIDWYAKRENHYYGINQYEEFLMDIRDVEEIEKIINGEELNEYFRVRVKYSFNNPIINNALMELEEIYRYDMQGNCIGEDI